MNLIMWVYTRLSSSQLLRLLHWSVFDLIRIFKIRLYILSFSSSSSFWSSLFLCFSPNISMVLPV
jgi:hypothetical protein